MKSIEFGQIVTVIANAGVIVSIVFLAVELSQTQEALQASTYQDRAFDGIDTQFEILANPELLKYWFDRIDLVGLTEQERGEARTLYRAFRIDLDNDFYQYRHGYLDSAYYEGNTAREIKTFAPIWRALGVAEGSVEFSNEVDRILADDSVAAFGYVQE